MNQSARRINKLADQLDARTYLEIGVFQGDTFREVSVPFRTGVDPGFAFDTSTVNNDSTRLVQLTSDAFFAAEAGYAPYDLVFIDGLHTFEQVVRDMGNALLHAHKHSVLIFDDTVPSDVYSAIPDWAACLQYRKASCSGDLSWHGDVFKIAFYIHDFWPSLNYCTIIGSGNPQTLVWRAKGERRTALFDNLETISRLTYFDLQKHIDILRMMNEDDAIGKCVSEIGHLD